MTEESGKHYTNWVDMNFHTVRVADTRPLDQILDEIAQIKQKEGKEYRLEIFCSEKTAREAAKWGSVFVQYDMVSDDPLLKFE